MNEMYPFNNQLITYFQHVSFLLRIEQYSVDNTYNMSIFQNSFIGSFQPLFQGRILLIKLHLNPKSMVDSTFKKILILSFCM